MKVTQSCPTLCDPTDCIVHGILQARTLEWVAFPFSRDSSQPRSPALQADSLPAEPPGTQSTTIFYYLHFCVLLVVKKKSGVLWKDKILI